MCQGCTAGGYGACPPESSAFGEVCSEDPTEQSCRDRAVPPQKVSQSTSMMRHTRDVRLLYGIATCAQFREDGEAVATTGDRVCDGDCQ